MLDPEITPEAFQQLLKQPNPPISGRRPRNLGVQCGPSARVVADAYGRCPLPRHQELDPDEPIVVLCHHGARSLSVTMWLRQQGFDHAQSLAGGIDRWSRTIDPVIPRY